MAAGRVKAKEGERLDDENVERVMALFESEKPITIKAACEELNIASNGARLKKIFAEFKDRKALRKKFRDANRGKPATDTEIASIVEQFLVGESIKDIAEGLYRSDAFVKRVIDEVGIPQALPGETYANYGPLPEQCVSDSFRVGEYVWSSKYGGVAEIDKDMEQSNNGSPVYRVFVHQQIDESKALIEGKRYEHTVLKGGGFYAHQPAYELGSLEHLRKYGVDVKRAIK